MSSTVLTAIGRWGRAILALAALGTTGAVSFWDPVRQPLGRCLFHDWTGLSCLTCGMSRALAEAGRFHFAEAFRWHPFGLLLWGLLILIGLWMAWEAWKGRPLFANKGLLLRKLLGGFILLWVGFGLGRMGYELVSRWF